MSKKPSSPGFFLLLMAGVAILFALLLQPLAAELFIAAVFAAVLWPAQEWLRRKLRIRRGLVTGALLVVLTLLVLGPLSTLIAVLIQDGSDGITYVLDTLRSEQMAAFVEGLPEPVRNFLTDGIANLPKNVGELVKLGAGNVDDISGAAVGAATATGLFLFHATMMLIALFFFLANGDALVAWLDSASPLRPGQTSELLTTFKNVSYSVIVSTLLTATAQTFVALAGYVIASVPSPIFFASVTFVTALIPAVGAAAVCLAAALLLFITGHSYMAIFLAAWGTFAVGLVDNVLKPLLINRGMALNSAIVFFALIGGMAAFGAIGILLGPLIVAMGLALVRMYHIEYAPKDEPLPLPGLPDEPTSQ